MDFSEKIVQQYRDTADKKVSLSCRIMIVLMILVAVLNAVGIFKIDPKALNITVFIAIAIFFLPTLFYDLLKIREKWVRYLFLITLVVQSGILYAVLSYHTIIMLIFPIVLSCLYNQRRYVLFTSILTVPMIIISHLAAFYLKVVPDEPLVTMKGVVLYGIFPRVIQACAIGIACYFISNRIEKLVNLLASKNDELYTDQEQLIGTLSEMIDTQSVTTGGHVKRVGEYSEILAKAMGFSEEEAWKIGRAAMMHDVGKLMVPQKILDKPGKLTSEEFNEVKKHVIYGRKMLENSPGELMQLSAKIAYLHHERWDGKGYLGLKGEDIDVVARCVALADVFDALVSKRPYKEAWGIDAAYDEIISQTGKQFDPEVVLMFKLHFEEFKEVLRQYPDTSNVYLDSTDTLTEIKRITDRG